MASQLSPVQGPSYAARPYEHSGGQPSGSGDSGANGMQRLSINEEDEAVLMAVRALGDMRNQRLSPQPTSSPHDPYRGSALPPDSPSYPTFPPGAPGSEYGSNSADFVSRVAHFPIVNTAIRAYETGKASSRVVKYGAEMMESSVRSISKPVINRLPVAQMDDFACRQLDRLEGRSRPLPTSYSSQSSDGTREWEVNTPTSMKALYSHEDAASSALSLESQMTYSAASEGPPSLASSRDLSTQSGQGGASRAGWQNMLVGAGGFSAAVSDDNMKRLKFCLEWLQWATRTTDQQISILRNLITSLALSPPPPPSPDHPSQRTFDPHTARVTPGAARTLAEARTGVVETIREVVHVVSQYAGSALPEPARATVRAWILELPQRWQAATREQQRAAAEEAHVQRRYRGAADQHQQASVVERGGEGLPTVAGAKTVATKLLTLALESLDMLKAVTKVFMDSLDSAEGWLDRMRSVGLRPEDAATATAASSAAPTPRAQYPAYPWQQGSKPDANYAAYYAPTYGDGRPMQLAYPRAVSEGSEEDARMDTTGS